MPAKRTRNKFEPLLNMLSFELRLSECVCNDILSVLDNHLIPTSNSGESKVFYYKMYDLNSSSEAHLFYIGREITTDIWLNSLLETAERLPQRTP